MYDAKVYEQEEEKKDTEFLSSTAYNSSYFSNINQNVLITSKTLHIPKENLFSE